MKSKLTTHKNGDKSWWLDSKRHREDGSAVECINGDKAWFLNGKRHREDGPVIEYINGRKQWYLNGKLHREDGPAIEWLDGNGKEWYLSGMEYSKKEYKYKMRSIKLTKLLK
jgi:hypothetical protein